MRSYELEFVEAALKEWRKLNPAIRQQFAKKLGERLKEPHVPGSRLHGLADCYKIKLRSAGYRLVYRVEEGRLVVVVVAVARRDRNEVYKRAAARLD